MRSFALVVALGLCALPACTTYRDDLARSEHAFEENRHEAALAILRLLEPDISELNDGERARYAYVRGMTDYRIGYKADARHWLAVAKAMDEKSPGIIPSDWRSRLDTSLAELDQQVWNGGMESLSNASVNAHAHKPRRAPKAVEPAAEPSSEEEEEQPKPAPRKKPKADQDEDE